MIAGPSFCLACGKRCIGEFCCDGCAQQGSRLCPCGVILRRRSAESTHWFRRRKFCCDDCRTEDIAARLREQWHTPETRARMMRGLYLVTNTDENVHRARATMQDNWQQEHFRKSIRHRRRFSAEQVRAIRADPRPTQAIGEDYGISQQSVSKIKLGMYYKDVS